MDIHFLLLHSCPNKSEALWEVLYVYPCSLCLWIVKFIQEEYIYILIFIADWRSPWNIIPCSLLPCSPHGWRSISRSWRSHIWRLSLRKCDHSEPPISIKNWCDFAFSDISNVKQILSRLWKSLSVVRILFLFTLIFEVDIPY